MSKVLFSSVAYARYDENQTLPAKFDRMLEKSGLAERVNGKTVAIKMHVGDGTGYSTIPPVFIAKLVAFLKKNGARCFCTDHYVYKRNPEIRGYTEPTLGCPVLDDCGYFGKYFYTKEVDYKSFRHVDVAGLIHDADFLIDFSHFKGHGACGFGGACKNLAMGAVTDRTRHEIHSLEGGLEWDEKKCVHCDACIKSCNHEANSFDKEGKYRVNFHHCTSCTHCVKVCPTGALTLTGRDNVAFQHGLALCTKTVLETFEPGNAYFISLVANVTALCDCWGLTTPSLVPDVGMFASDDIVAIERACLDSIKIENLIPVGVPQGMELGTEGHLFQRLHGKDPYVLINEMESLGMGSQDVELVTVR